MKKFFCPHCKNNINPVESGNPNGYIQLWIKNQKNQKGMLLVNPELGNYTVEQPADFSWEKGEVLDISCPMCKKSLILSPGSSRASIFFEEEEKQKRIIFSAIIGEKLTYIIDPVAHKVISYGPDARDEKDLWKKFTQ